MTRTLRLLLLALSCLLVVGATAQDFSKVEVKAERLTDSLYLLTGAGGNIALSIGADATFIVDDQFAPLTPKIEAAIARLTDKPVKFVLNTHWHYDHTGGNENLGRKGVLILAHENVRKRMSTDQFIEFLRSKVPASAKEALPGITFASDLTLHLNGEEIHAFHVSAAHTDGDAIVQFRKANIIHMGDTYFNGFYPFIDTASGGNVDGVIAAADRVIALADDATRIIPGHGPMSNKVELKAYRDMLATVAGRIKAALKGGRKLEQIVADKPTADLDTKWGKGFIGPDKFVEMLWGNLVK